MRRSIVIVLLVAAVFGTNATAQNTEVKKWPDDVPCDAVKKNPDGSYTQLIDLNRESDLWYHLNEFGFSIRCFTPQYES
jgi:hypothetical protein